MTLAPLAEAERIAGNRRMFVEAATNLRGMIDQLPEWLEGDDPALINRVLSLVVEKVIVRDDGIELFLK